MKTVTFKTNIKCSGCIATVTPVLNNLVGENNWQVDLQDIDKKLSLDSDEPQAVVDALKAVGYNAEEI